jgi:Flp pilus assembly protein TadD
MSLISKVLGHVAREVSGARRFTAPEVHELIQQGRVEEAKKAAARLHADTADREVVMLCLLGEVAFRKHEDAEAERLFREALKIAPGRPEGHYGLSLVMLARNEGEAALRHAQFAANAEGKEARFFAQLGLCQLSLNNYRQAAGVLAQATRLDPLDKSSWNNFGIASRAHGKLTHARKAFKRALEIDPAFDSARNNLRLLELDAQTLGDHSSVETGGEAAAEQLGAHVGLHEVRQLRSEDRLADALESCESLFLNHPEDGSIVVELYQLYREFGDVGSGIDAMQAYLIAYPDDEAVTHALIQALVQERDFKAAKPLLEKALERNPSDTSLIVAMADVRMEQGRYLDAGELIAKAFEIAPSMDMKGRLAASCLARCDYDRTLRLVDEMLAEDPGVAEMIAAVRVDALTHSGRHDEALPILDTLINRSPHDHARRFPRAAIHLLNERFEQGWEDYLYRNLASTKHLRMVALPQWSGQPIEGKRLLVLAEQGLGDQVMFASCLPDLLKEQPSRVVVEVVDRVAPTLARSFPEVEVVSTKQDRALDWIRDIGEMDYFIPIGDLPRLYRKRRQDFPPHNGYLVPDSARVAHWRTQLAGLGHKPRIGVSWKGGTEPTRTVMRTMKASQVAALATTVDAEWVCLQYGPVSEALDEARAAGMHLHHWPEAIKNLDEFAALISALDLVVTVCNTTVHYAGALGKPVWVMAPKIPEWRYGLHSTVMPWYPSSRLFRQQVVGDWVGVLAAVGSELSDHFGPTRL